MAGIGPVNDVLGWLRASKLLPQLTVDGMPVQARGGKYGEGLQELLSTKNYRQCLEGSAMHWSSPTPGTGLAQIAAPTSYVTTSPYLILQNTAAVGGKSLIPDFIKLTLSAVQTGNATQNFVIVTDTINRWSSGGSAGGIGTGGTMNGPFPTSQSSQQGSLAQVYAGALVSVAASNSARMYSHGQLRTAIPAVGDSWCFDFGAASVTSSSLAKNGTAPSDFVIPVPAIEIPPQGSLLLYLWAASQSAAGSFEVEGQHFER
jgi:hypothetical protein